MPRFGGGEMESTDLGTHRGHPLAVRSDGAPGTGWHVLCPTANEITIINRAKNIFVDNREEDATRIYLVKL